MSVVPGGGDDVVPGQYRGSKPGPWAIELRDGQKCEAVSGAGPTLGEVRINYKCNPDGGIVGYPNRSKPLWTVDHIGRTDTATTTKAVAQVWY